MNHSLANPPVPLPPMPFSIPDAPHLRLENGLQVVLLPIARVPIASLRLAVFSGEADDPSEKFGLTSALASMMTEGSARYSSRELAEKAERLGLDISVGSSADFLLASVSGLSIYLDDIFELAGEIVLRPTFPENELDLYRRNTIENLKFQRSQPNFLAAERTALELYGEHPYARIAPLPEVVRDISAEDLRRLHSRNVIPNNAMLFVIGDYNEFDVRKKIEEVFGEWPASEKQDAQHTPPNPRRQRTISVIDRPGSAQTNIVLADLAVRRNHPDYFPLLVMNQILGAGASSRVFMNLREAKGYTYGAYTRLDLKKNAGEFEATAEVRTQVTGPAIKEFLAEFERIRTERVAPSELEDAKSYLTGVFPIRSETLDGLTSLIVNQYLYDLPKDYLQTYRENVAAVSVDDVFRVATQYIRPERMAIVLVGDAAEVIPQVSVFSEALTIFDADGNRLEKAKFTNAESISPDEIAGKWDITLDFQGQEIPVTLHLKNDAGSITGTLETMLGNGIISSAEINGCRLTAVAISELQGGSIELSINGVIEAGTMSGTIGGPILPVPMQFRATKAV
ncbi:MAG: hypothetical protein C4325_14505 [Blastocatellia bacterium]